MQEYKDWDSNLLPDSASTIRRTTERRGKRRMKTVEKKILPKYFQAVRDEKKNFELRKDEENIQPGDVLILMEWEIGGYTGRTEVRRVKYVLRNVPEYGLMQGYCIIGW